MHIEKDVDLYSYSTMRTHSRCDVMYFPENTDELISLLKQLGGECYFLGAGSNVVFASMVRKPIVNLMSLNNDLKDNSDGTVTAGCSIRIQRLINFGKELSLGGFEYLYSLPASVGGIVYMNAGRGKIHNQQISDWLDTITYLDLTDMLVKTMAIDNTQWSYRCSPFQHMKAVILSATFRMKPSSVEEINAEIQRRKDIVKVNQEGNKPSCGSVFNQNNKYIMRLLRGKRIGGACYSKRTNNWISNDQNGTADDVIALIDYAQKWHKRLGLSCTPEIRIFK